MHLKELFMIQKKLQTIFFHSGSASHFMYQIYLHVNMSVCLPYIRSRHGVTRCETRLHIDFKGTQNMLTCKICRLFVNQSKLN